METGQVALSDNEKGQRKKGQAGAESARGERSSGRNGPRRDVGAALRSVFQNTVNEGVPQEMLDLLGKLD